MPSVNLDFLFNHTKIVLVIFLILIIAIPSLAFLVKQRSSFYATTDSEQSYNRTVTFEATSGAKEVPKDLPADILKQGSSKESEEETTSTESSDGLSAQVTFGPTLNFKLKVQGRPPNKQSLKTFVGLSADPPGKSNPQYLLSFSVDVPDSGVYTGLSLAGLTIGNTYTAFIKGSSQIATASAFAVNPNVTELNSGLPLNLISGDLNEDNVIDSTDYTISSSYLGKTPTSPGWNGSIDLNADNIVNTLDLAIILSNMNRTGAGDQYISRLATKSANLNKVSPQGGYWMWVPEF